MDTEACSIATSMKDALGAPPSVRPTADTATHTDDSSGHAAFACDIEDTTGRAKLTTGALDAPSSSYSPVDAAIGYTSLVNAEASPTPLTLTTGTTPSGFWRVCQRGIFFGASHRRAPCPPMLKGT